MSIVKDEEFELDKLIFNCNFICSNCKSSNNDLVEKCEKILEFAKFVDKHAYEHCFLDLPVNGLLQFIGISTQLTDLIVKEMKTNKEIDPDLLNVLVLLSNHKDLLFEHYNSSSSSSSSSSSLLSSKAFYNTIQPTRVLLMFISFLMALIEKLPYSLSTLWTNRGAYIAHAIKNSISVGYPFSLWQSLVENWFTLQVINLFNFGVPVASKRFHAPRQQRFKVNYKGEILDLKNEKENKMYCRSKEDEKRNNSPGLNRRNNETSVICKYIYLNGSSTSLDAGKEKFKNLAYYTAEKKRSASFDQNNNHCCSSSQEQSSSSSSDKVIVLYFHGGGYAFGGSSSSEIYLKDIVNALRGVPVLSVDYSLCCPFPILTQEALDVYLWLFSGAQQVEDTIGFHPTRLVLGGDSAGAQICLSLAILINELNKKFDLKLPRPTSIVATYPTTTLGFESQLFSRSLMALEPIIETHLYSNIMSKYFADIATLGEFRQSVPANNNDETSSGKHENYDLSSGTSDDTRPWYECDYQTYQRYAKHIESIYSDENNAILSPILYNEKFIELADTAIYLQVGKYDFLLDDTLLLANKWKGNVCVDVIFNVPHAFQHLKMCGKDNKDASELVIYRFQQACGLI